MNYRKYKNVKYAIICVLLSAIVALSLIITFSDGKNAPTWKDISVSLGYEPDTDQNSDYIRFFDVGQGDGALIYSNGKTALIDAGTRSSSTDLCNNLHSLGIDTIDALIISHCHDDHYGGLDEIAERFTVKNLIIPDINKTDESTKTLVNARKSVLAEDGEVYTAVQGMNMNVGDFKITVLAYYSDLPDENSRSLIVMAETGGVKFLFTGDADKETERRLISNRINLDCDVLKVGHHGSSESTTADFLDKTTPDSAVISCGLGNQYSHPHDDTLVRLDNKSVDIYRTDFLGDITYYVEKGKTRIETEK